MKKSVIALAIAGTFAVAGAAQAQTTVTPYFTLDSAFGISGTDSENFGAQAWDAGVATIEGGLAAGQLSAEEAEAALEALGDRPDEARTDLQHMDSNIASSVFGLRAQRDLGNGLTAHGHIEGDANTATGDVNPAGTWRRAANVGLSGAFGRVDVGTRINPFIALHGATYAMGGNSVSTNVAASMGFADFFRTNSITYTAPALGGIALQAQYATPVEDEYTFAATAVWRDGPIMVGAGVDVVSEEAGSGHRAERTTALLGGTYTLGNLVLSGNFINNDVEGEDDDNWLASVGAAFRMNQQTTLGGTFAHHESGSFLVNLQARYAFHPAAMVYAMVSHASVDEDAGLRRGNFLTVWGDTASGPELGEADTGAVVGMLLSF